MSTARKLSLAVQYACAAETVPTRAQFRRWAALAQEKDVQVTVRLVDEAEGRELNKSFRARDYATNVLTFVYEEDGRVSGDIVICAPVVEREAREHGKDLRAHYAHLTVHAMLHLQGYDHENEGDAARMEQRETALLAKLGYPDPYCVTQH